jgi:hypothetical protein
MFTKIRYQITFDKRSKDQAKFLEKIDEKKASLCRTDKNDPDIMTTPIDEFFTEAIKKYVAGYRVRLLVPERMYKTKEGFAEFVAQMELDKIYTLPKYKYTNISIREDSGDGGYIWSMERNYDVVRMVGYVHPLKSGDRVQTFKTIKGCKQSLIKHNDWVWGNK